MKRIARRGMLGLAVLAVGGTVAVAAGNPQPPGVTFSVASDDSGRDAPVDQCSANGFSLIVANNTAAEVDVVQFVDKLYSGFHYVPGSSTITDINTSVVTPLDDPSQSIAGGGAINLQYHGTYPVPANDTVILHFDATVLDRSDPIVKAPTKGSFPDHGVVSYGGSLAGTKIGQNTSVRVSKSGSVCSPV